MVRREGHRGGEGRGFPDVLFVPSNACSPSLSSEASPLLSVDLWFIRRVDRTP